MTALFQPAELHSGTTQTETGRWRNRRRKPKRLQTENLSTFAVCSTGVKLVDVIWLKSLLNPAGRGDETSVASHSYTSPNLCELSHSVSCSSRGYSQDISKLQPRSRVPPQFSWRICQWSHWGPTCVTVLQSQTSVWGSFRWGVSAGHPAASTRSLGSEHPGDGCNVSWAWYLCHHQEG